MVDILERLKEAGLTGNEAKVYYEILKRGELSANQAAKNISLDRTLTYTLLNNLIEKGQVGYIIKEKKKFFSITKPENLLNTLKKKEIIVNDLIEELNKITVLNEPLHDIRVYEGKDGLRSFVNLILKEKEFCAFGSTGWAYSQLYEMPRIVKTYRNKIKIRLIGSKKLKKSKTFSIKDFNCRFIDAESKSPTSIFGDYVSIHLTTKEKPYIILIKNKDIAETYKNYFEVLWKIAKK
jgi:sugar-specific transcriptional regulator TrmB